MEHRRRFVDRCGVKKSRREDDGPCERGRERQREGETDRQTDRQTETDREREQYDEISDARLGGFLFCQRTVTTEYYAKSALDDHLSDWTISARGFVHRPAPRHFRASQARLARFIHQPKSEATGN
jgi:hypothetical protein